MTQIDTAQAERGTEGRGIIAQGLSMRSPMFTTGKGVNVDKSERLFMRSLLNPNQDSIAAISICRLEESKKHVVFRGKTATQILDIQKKLLSLMKRELGVENLSLIGTNDNHKDSDLYELNLHRHIELKLGSATDAALGMNHLETITGAGVLKALPSTEDREKWRAMYANGEHDAVASAYLTKLIETKDAINANLPAGREVSDKVINHTLNMLYAGINQFDRINASRTGTPVPEILRFSVNRNGQWKRDVRPALPANSTWVFEGATVTNKGRLNMRFHNGSYYVRFTFNQKNSYSNKGLGIERSSGKYGLGYLSMNVWVRKISARQLALMEANKSK